MKKKILAFAVVFAMAAIAIVGGTMAYFTDSDAKDNVFTTGKVDITLGENFEQGSKLLPATGSAQAGTLKNGIKKEVTVKNEADSEEAYVRVHIAIPSILDDGDSTFDAGNNVLHFNFSPDSVGDGLWNWSKSKGKPYTGDWNYYEADIDGVTYNVYVVTYESALKNGETTLKNAMDQVYLDSKVTNEDIKKIKDALPNGIQIKVIAEGVQAAGFDNAYDALNTAFGEPGKYTPDWTKVESK